MTVYIVAGGMVATTWIQIVKAVLLIAGTLTLSVIVLANYGFNPVALFNAVDSELGAGMITPPAPGGLLSGIDVVSLNVALVFGTAGLPHILMRFLTVPDARTARVSIIWATWIIGGFYLLTPAIGYGAALFVGQDVISAQNPAGNTAAPQLAGALGGPIFLAFISAVAFATIVAVVAGLVLAASSAFAHDFYTNVIRGGEATEREQLRAARIAAVGVAVGAMFFALFAQGFNVSFLVALAFAIAASANVPTILFTIFWRRFNTAGAIAGILTGLFSCLILIALSPNMLQVIPLANPAIISFPLGCLACYLGTILGGKGAERERREGKQISYDEIYVRSLTGISNVEREIQEAAPTQEPRTS